jgi:PHP family Zn ribbon phosphoesterase
MKEIDEIKELINKINLRDLNSRDYQKMKIEELSANIREAMKFQQDIIQRIEEFEIKGLQPDLTKYAKIICKNTTEREILKIQEVYLKKIENEYLK